MNNCCKRDASLNSVYVQIESDTIIFSLNLSLKTNKFEENTLQFSYKLKLIRSYTLSLADFQRLPWSFKNHTHPECLRVFSLQTIRTDPTFRGVATETRELNVLYSLQHVDRHELP